jgi:signal transduction histidine kinase
MSLASTRVSPQQVARLLVLVALLWTQALYAAEHAAKSVLVIYGDAEVPAYKLFDPALREAVSAAIKDRVVFYTEYVNIPRFPERKQQDAFVTLLRERYGNRKIDVLVAVGPAAFDFITSRTDLVLTNTPLVHGLLSTARIKKQPPSSGAVGIPVDFSGIATIELALRLHPEAQRLLLVTGGGDFGRGWEQRLRAETAKLASKVKIEFLTRVPTPKLLERLSMLPPKTVVFAPGYFTDGAGDATVPRDAVAAMTARSAAPIYTPYETHLGTGAVGGVVTTFEALGRQTGAIVAAILDGKAPSELGILEPLHAEPIVDWRQVGRWGIEESLLPPGTVVRHREPDLWERYRRGILIAIAVLAFQSALIVALLVERRTRRRTAAALEVSENSMALAATAANLTTWVWDSERDRFWLMPTYKRLQTVPDDQPLTLKQALSEIHPADRERVENMARKSLRTNEDMNIEYRVQAEGTEVRWIASRGRADSGGRLLGVALDVTERKIAELQAAGERAALRHMTRVSALGQLSASIAHELSQPLTAILSNAEAARRMLARGQPDLAELGEICNDIVTEDKRAAAVIGRLRELFKRGEPQLRALDINELIRDTLDLLHNELLIRRITALTDLAPGMPAVQGDRVELQQVLLNLIVNAAEAMEGCAEEDRRLTVRSDVLNDEARIQVSDCGVGITAADMDRIFEPFWTSKPGGLGMGLAICRSIVEAHNGLLTASNNADRGSSFIVSLPVRPAAHDS